MLYAVFSFLLLQINILYPPDSLTNPRPKLAPVEEIVQVPDTSALLVTEILISGNVITKSPVVMRELLFKNGSFLNKKDIDEVLQRSRNNIYNTGLFHQVNVNYLPLGENKIKIVILLTERWYFWPFPILELADRNFNVWWRDKDLSRLNVGMYLVKMNFRGQKETLVFRFKYGFTRQIGLSYNIPYIDKRQNSGLSFSVTYSQNKQIILNTLNDKVRFFKDFESFARKEWIGLVSYTYRKGIYATHGAILRYTNTLIGDTISRLNPDYFGSKSNHLQFLSLEYNFKYDKRDYRAYPLKGYYFDISAVQNGFGLFKDESVDMSYLTVTGKYFFKWNSRWFSALSVRSKYSSSGFQPYYLQRALGYFADYIRGYEYYAIDGQHFILGKTALKYNLLAPGKKQIPFIKNPKLNNFQYALYLNAFADAAYVEDKLYQRFNTLSNQWQYSYGIGLDFVGQNDLVLRMEYSINRFLQQGLYFHVAAPL